MNNLDGKRLSDFKQWRCSKNDLHVLGVLERVSVNVTIDGTNFRYYSPRLMVFRVAVDLSTEIPNEVDVAGTIEGKTLFDMAWRCSVPGCGGIKKWFAEKELIEYFVKTYLAE